MARKRVVRTYSDTRARGERKAIEGDRYFVRVELVSAKVTKSSDGFLSRKSQIYFKTDRKRVPNKGTIDIEINEVFKPTGKLTLYTHFKKKKGGGSDSMRFKIFDHDLIGDDELIDEKISVVLGQSREYLVFDKNGIRVKIEVSAKKTRF